MVEVAADVADVRGQQARLGLEVLAEQVLDAPEAAARASVRARQEGGGRAYPAASVAVSVFSGRDIRARVEGVEYGLVRRVRNEANMGATGAATL